MYVCVCVCVCVCVWRDRVQGGRDLSIFPSWGEGVVGKGSLLTLRTLLEFRWFSNWVFLSSTHSDCVYHLPNYCPYLSCSLPSSFVCPFIGMKVKVLVTQSCLTLWHPKDYIPPGSSVQGILQARIMQWFAISFSDLANPGIEPSSPALQVDSLPCEPKGKPSSWYGSVKIFHC